MFQKGVFWLNYTNLAQILNRPITAPSCILNSRTIVGPVASSHSQLEQSVFTNQLNKPLLVLAANDYRLAPLLVLEL
jgi:hypothetical protein